MLVNADIADAAPDADGAADNVRDRGTPDCGPAGALAGVGAGAGGAGVAAVPLVAVFVVAVASGLNVPATTASLCGKSLALCPFCLQIKQLNASSLLKRGMSS